MECDAIHCHRGPGGGDVEEVLALQNVRATWARRRAGSGKYRPVVCEADFRKRYVLWR